MEDSIKTTSWLPDNCLMTAWKKTDKPNNCLMTAWQLLDNCLMTARQLPDSQLYHSDIDYLITLWWLPNDCSTAVQLPDDYQTNAWQLCHILLIITAWQLPKKCLITLITAHWLLNNFCTTSYWLPNKCLMVASYHSNNCLTTNYWLPFYCMMTAKWLPNAFCLTACWLPDNYLMTA